VDVFLGGGVGADGSTVVGLRDLKEEDEESGDGAIGLERVGRDIEEVTWFCVSWIDGLDNAELDAEELKSRTLVVAPIVRVRICGEVGVNVARVDDPGARGVGA